jgi:hypothetical protein
MNAQRHLLRLYGACRQRHGKHCQNNTKHDRSLLLSSAPSLQLLQPGQDISQTGLSIRIRGGLVYSHLEAGGFGPLPHFSLSSAPSSDIIIKF